MDIASDELLARQLQLEEKEAQHTTTTKKKKKKKRQHQPPKWDGRSRDNNPNVTTIVNLPGAGGGFGGVCAVADRLAAAVTDDPRVQMVRFDIITNRKVINGERVGITQAKVHCTEEGVAALGNRVILVCNSMSGGIAPTLALWLHEQGVVVLAVIFISAQSGGTAPVQEFPSHVSVYVFHGEKDVSRTYCTLFVSNSCSFWSCSSSSCSSSSSSVFLCLTTTMYIQIQVHLPKETNAEHVLRMARKQGDRITDYVLMPGADHCLYSLNNGRTCTGGTYTLTDPERREMFDLLFNTVWFKWITSELESNRVAGYGERGRGGGSGSGGNNDSGGSGGETKQDEAWSCANCTFVNSSGIKICEMCSKTQRTELKFNTRCSNCLENIHTDKAKFCSKCGESLANVHK